MANVEPWLSLSVSAWNLISVASLTADCNISGNLVRESITLLGEVTVKRSTASL